MNLMHIGFLAAGAAAMTLPLWIHLLLRQRAIPMEIGSIRFIKQVVRRSKNRQKIQRWLLLLLRAIAVMLLGLLFARPFLPGTPADGSTREIAVLIDRSASMMATHDDGTTAIQSAVQRAKQYISDQGDLARVHLAVFDASGVQPIQWNQLDQLTSSSSATGYDAAFDWATDRLTATDRVDRSLLVLSDLQHLGVSQVDGAAFPDDVSVRIEDPAPTVAQNLAIESALATQVEIRPGVPIAVNIIVVNHGAFPVVDVPLRLRINGPGQPVEINRSLSLAAGQRQSISIELPVLEPGVYLGAVHADLEDPLSWDNQRSIGFDVRHPDRLLLIDGDAGQKSWENETYFVETALRLQTPIGRGPARTFEVARVVWDRGSGFPDLQGFRLIVMANVSRLTATDAERMKAFVSAGGNVLWFPGDRWTDAVQNQLLQSGLLGTTQLGRPTDALSRVIEFDSKHPALAPFADPQHGDLRGLVANRVLPISAIDPETNVLIRSRRFPILVSHQSGAGQFVLCTTTADRDWNDWPQNRLFVPLIRQIAAWLTGQFDAKQLVQTQIITQSDQQPGVQTQGDLTVVHCVDPTESQINRLGVDQFREAIGLPEKALISEEFDRIAEYTPDGVARADEKWPWVVWALIGILSSEFILASRVHE